MKSQTTLTTPNIKETAAKNIFAAYVDTMPLKWNLYFFPQSLYCNGIHRVLKDYDFIGYMDSSFYDSLNSLGKRYGGRFKERVSDVFDLAKNIEKSARINTRIETRHQNK